MLADVNAASVAELAAAERAQATAAETQVALAAQLSAERVRADELESRLAELAAEFAAAVDRTRAEGEHQTTDIQDLVVQVDRYLGFVESVRSICLTAGDEAHASDEAALLSWVETLAGAGLDQLRADKSYLESELQAVRAHRDELVEQINLVCASESWKIGYALTWPARKLRSGQRGA